MSKKVSFEKVPLTYQKRPNKFEYVRVHILGVSRPEFMKAALSTNSMSTQTLRNVERDDGGNPTTRTKFFETIKKLLEDAGYEPISRDELYSPFPKN